MLFAYRVYDSWVGNWKPIGAIGVGKDSKLNPSNGLYEGRASGTFTEVAIAPCGGYLEAVKYIDGMGNTVASAIAAVIVGCREDIKASFTEGYCEGFGEENMG